MLKFLEKEKVYLFIYGHKRYRSMKTGKFYKDGELSSKQIKEKLKTEDIKEITIKTEIPFFVKSINIGKIGCFKEDYCEDLQSDLPYRNANGEIDMSLYEFNYELSMPCHGFFDPDDAINSFAYISHRDEAKVLGEEIKEWEMYLTEQRKMGGENIYTRPTS